MGMYTELYLSCEIKDEAPEEVKQIIEHLFGDLEEIETPPDHWFFSCGRWEMVGSCSSYYFTPFASSQTYTDFKGSLSFTTRFDLKNYDGEIQGFLDWVMPYIDACEGDHLGHYRYEEDLEPTMIYYGKELL